MMRTRMATNEPFVVGVVLVLCVVLAAILAPLLASTDPYLQDLGNRLAGPGSPGHLLGTDSAIYDNPTHPYTQALLSAVPVADPALRDRAGRIVLTGSIPNPANPPSGCVFRTRCWKADAMCAAEVPALADRQGIGHPSACHYPEPLAPTRGGEPIASAQPRGPAAG